MLEAVSLDPAARLALRAALALLLLSAALHKLRDSGAFRRALAGYALLPDHWLPSVSALFIALELAVGASLVLAGRSAGLAAAALLGVYSGAIAVNLLRGRRGIDCGCAGPTRRVPLGGGLLVRNVLLIAAALLAALPATPRALLWLDAVTVVASGAALALLYTAADTALANTLRLAMLRAQRIVDPVPHAVTGGSQWSLP